MLRYLLSGVRVLLTVVLLVACSAPVSAQRAEWSGDLETRVAAEMSRLIRAGRIAGAVTLVADADSVVLATAHGQADIAAGRAMMRDSLFRVASMTKPVTAAALVKLVAAKKVQPDDPVSKYLPAFAQQKLRDGTAVKAITIRDVLTHTAGLASSSGLNGDRTLGQEVDALAAQPLQSPPGSRWQYSSGLTVAGRIVEVVSGLPFEDFLKEQVFQPLGMGDTAFVLTAEQAGRLAVTYRPGQEGQLLQPVEIPDPTQARMPNPSGGLYSTADDMAKFFQAILRERQGAAGHVVGSAELVRQMLTPQTGDLVTGFTPGNSWGLGWCVVQQPQGVTRLLSPGTFGHGGAWGTQAWVDPVRGLVLLLMIQRTEFGNSDASEVRDAFNEAVITSYVGKQQESARVAPFLGYQNAVHLQLGSTRAVLCPEAGGRVVSFSAGGEEMMFVDERERNWRPGAPPSASAGRFDIGPELVIPKHPALWSGPWSWELTGPGAARLVSVRDEATGVQLVRDFRLRPVVRPSDVAAATVSSAVLECRQVIMNVSDRVVEYCHWGRSFSPGGGICVIPLGSRPSRFPSKYVMYEEQGINPSAVDEKIRERDGFLEILAPPRRPKLGFDTFGSWLAYVQPSNRVFIKRFAAYPDRVYNEAAGLTLSVWYPQQGGMIELEPIGPRERLEPGQTAEFTEEWSVGEFPYPAAGQQIDLARLQQMVESAAPPAGNGR